MDAAQTMNRPGSRTEALAMATAISARDPVCGMTLETFDIAIPREYGGQTYYFCSPVCWELFDRDPSRYASPAIPLAYARVGIVGLPCAGEAHQMERRLAKIDGIVHVTVNPVTEEAYLTFDSNRLSLADVKAAVADACAAFW
jgi:YHS domain-containing protein/copper chaperone CopZ